MSRQSDFVMHYEDSSCPLNDMFTHSDNQDWTTKSKTHQSINDVASIPDSFIDIQLLDASHTCIFNTLSRDTDQFAVITDPNAGTGLPVDSHQLKADQLSEQTGFSGYFSDTKTERHHTEINNVTHQSSPQKVEQEKDAPESHDGVPKFIYKDGVPKEVQKPPTTAGIKLEDLKAVFHLERPKAEKKLGLKRTTFSNLSRHYGISKWPFRTIRDALNRMEANKRLLDNASVSKERRRKLLRQQKLLHDVIDLIYKDPRHSRDSNTLAVLLMIVAAKNNE